jgi:hypothetical protein
MCYEELLGFGLVSFSKFKAIQAGNASLNKNFEKATIA